MKVVIVAGDGLIAPTVASNLNGRGLRAVTASIAHQLSHPDGSRAGRNIHRSTGRGRRRRRAIL